MEREGRRKGIGIGPQTEHLLSPIENHSAIGRPSHEEETAASDQIPLVSTRNTVLQKIYNDNGINCDDNGICVDADATRRVDTKRSITLLTIDGYECRRFDSTSIHRPS